MVGIVLEPMLVALAPQDLLWTMMMMSPLVMPFVWGILFGMQSYWRRWWRSASKKLDDSAVA
jgi:hypothetical protein